MVSNTLTYAVLASGLAAAQTISFEGRVPKAMKLTDFDVKNELFNFESVKGDDQIFSDLLQLEFQPPIAPSLFDVNNTVPLGVEIFDKSIFNKQTGFRRSELIPASNTGTDPSTKGVKTTHFSLMLDPKKPLNESHEYQLFWLETNDFSTNQFVLKTGTIAGGTVSTTNALTFFGNVNDGKLLFSTTFLPDMFHNFAVTSDFDKNTIEIFYSQGKDPLASVLQVTDNDNSGQGQYHFGILKKGTGDVKDVTKDAFQPTGINEGIIYGGIFQEDTSVNPPTLAPPPA